MEVILLEKIANLGDLGDKVTVRPGYGRNYLVPQKKAVPATKENIEKFEARRAELEKAAAEARQEAEERAQKLEAIAEVTIASMAGEEGKLFGSIGVAEIAQALTDAGLEVAKREVSLPEGPLRHTGEYTVDIHLHTDVTRPVKVIVVAE